ncbi:unnamed protein product, partial [Didymodactylos carnosus]
LSKKKTIIKLECDNETSETTATTADGKTNGKRRYGTHSTNKTKLKRSSLNNSALLSTVTNVKEFMSLVMYKDNPPPWLKERDIYKEYMTKSNNNQKSNNDGPKSLAFYAKSSSDWQKCPSLLLSPVKTDVDTKKSISSPLSIQADVKIKPAQQITCTSRSSVEEEPVLRIKREPHSPPQPLDLSCSSLQFKLQQNVKQEKQDTLLVLEKTKLSSPIKDDLSFRKLKHNKSKIYESPKRNLCKKKREDPFDRCRKKSRSVRINSVETEELYQKKSTSCSTSPELSLSYRRTSRSPRSPEYVRHHLSPIRMPCSPPLKTVKRKSSPITIGIKRKSSTCNFNNNNRRRSPRVWAPNRK